VTAARYDVAVVGASIGGCTAALAAAGRGDRVLLLEAAPQRAAASHAGEWLHPAAMDGLERIGVDLTPTSGYPTGRGFVVFPEDGSAPVVLPYRSGRFGFCLPYGLLVETLRAHCRTRTGIDWIPYGRATRARDGAITWDVAATGADGPKTKRGGSGSAGVGRVVCAAGGDFHATPRGRAEWSFSTLDRHPTHRIASVPLIGTELPFEGYRHLFVGGPGPVFAQRVGPSVIELSLDVPLGMRAPRDGGIALLEAYAPALPPGLVGPFAEALRRGAPVWCRGRLQPRGKLALDGLARVGDAAGSLHPLMAAGGTLAIGDALAWATAPTRRAYHRTRRRQTRVPETVAIGLTELLTDDAAESVTIRRSIYDVWREDSGERLRSMGIISGDHDGALRFGRSCLRVLLASAGAVTRRALQQGAPADTRRVGTAMAARVGWMLGGGLGWMNVLPDALAARLEARGASRFGAAIHREAEAEVVGLPRREKRSSVIRGALERGVDALLTEQGEDGSFEGEVVWCPMLAAQYVLAHHVMQRPIEERRKRLLLRHFSTTQLPGGAWGLHDKSEPYLFVSTLVYVAARLLGVRPDAPLIQAAGVFLRAEGGAEGIPSWGKLWLALVGLYEWDGVSPVVPELWSAPRWLPMHPARYYCHTRLIYMGMAALYGGRVTCEPTALIERIRGEIFTTPYDQIDFRVARETLREGDIHEAPGALLRLGYRALVQLEKTRSPASRAPLLAELRERIRYELRSTSYTSISPVSGLLGMLALHAADPDDADLAKGLDAFEGWIWEDEVEGARVAGARSATWDTSFAIQALTAAAPFTDLSEALSRADDFLATQQVQRGTGEEPENDRLDPTGGYCFAGVWHGWPVSDCTAEAMLARLESPVAVPRAEAMEKAAAFVLRCQNADGGFGSYESSRVRGRSLDWINPSEMFGACMTERSYVECTASCLAALATFRSHHPHAERARIDEAIDAAVHKLRAAQRSDGSFEGNWGVHFIYGTLFGIRGLLAAGVPPVDPAIRRACVWLLERQRPDGGWGEHFSSVVERRYVEHDEAQTVQTAWALSALLEAKEPNFAALERGAHCLAQAQRPDGTWPKQDPEGIFFHTALLEYRLYRSYFPPWALGLFAQRAEARVGWREKGRTRRPLAG